MEGLNNLVFKVLILLWLRRYSSAPGINITHKFKVWYLYNFKHEKLQRKRALLGKTPVKSVLAVV